MLMLMNSALSHISPSPLLPCHTTKTNQKFVTRNARASRRRWLPLTVTRVSSSDDPTVAVASSPPPPPPVGDDESVVVESAADVVRNFYAGINGRDLVSVEDLIADNCVYEDLIFPRPFVGRKEILQFFKKFIGSVGRDLQFVIDDLSTEDSSAVGGDMAFRYVEKLFYEWKRRPFPFSKGCSFYRLEVENNKRQIVYGRDSVEPAIKPGETALVAIRGVTWLLQQFPQLADQL